MRFLVHKLRIVGAAALSSCLVANARYEQYQYPSRIESSETCAFASDDAQGPVIFFTDLESGPNDGGEDGLGVFVTIYGLRFGAVPGRVTIGGEEVARYVSWNAPLADTSIPGLARGLETLTVQLGAKVRTGSIVVSVAGLSSNPLPFTVRPGNIFFVDPSAAPNGDGSAARPWSSLYSARFPAVRAGDTVYLKTAVFNQLDPSTQVDNHNTNLVLTTLDAASGTPEFPIAYLGYPGSIAVIGGTPSGGRSTRAIWLSATPGHKAPEHYVVANLVFRQTSQGALPISSPGMRIVGNRFSDVIAPWGFGAISTLDLRSPRVDAKILGNTLENMSGKGIATPGQVLGVEVGWNEVRNAGIDIYTQFGDMYAGELSIHDNLVTGRDSTSLVLGTRFAPRPSNAVTIFNNILGSDGVEGVGLSLSMEGDPEDVPIDIANNTLLESTPLRVQSRPGMGFVLRNNIFLSGSESAQVVILGEESVPASFDNNLYFGGPLSAERDARAITASPLLSFTGDLKALDPTPMLGSAAIDAGIDTGHCADYLGRLRPQGVAYDIGAVEHVFSVR
jgi:hypothetical protein